MNRHFLLWFWSASGGGGSQFAVNLARRLSLQFGPHAITLSLHADDPTLSDLSNAEFRVLAADVVTTRRDPLASAAGLARSATILRDHARDADCIIVPMNFAVAAPLSLTVNQPLIYFAHDPSPHPGDYARFGQRTTQAILLRRAKHVVALSNFAREQLVRLGVGADRLHVAPLLSVFAPDANEAAAAARSAPVRMLFAGRMLAYKGLDILSEALTLIQEREDWRLRIVGSGPALTPEMRARLSLKQVEAIDSSWITASAFDAAIRASDVMVAPYASATQSGVVAQALAFGKPCVVTPVGALPEQICNGEAGWIAERADGTAFSAAVEEALGARQHVEVKARAAHALARAVWEHDYWRWLEEL